MKSYEFDLTDSDRELLFAEVARLRSEYPDQCLDSAQLWSDPSEKANGITRDRATSTACVTMGVYNEAGEKLEYFSIREDSPALLSSQLFRMISAFIHPYEKLR